MGRCAGDSLAMLHAMLRDCPEPLAPLAILTESMELLETLEQPKRFPGAVLGLRILTKNGGPFPGRHSSANLVTG
jgi:hypothetical protein